MQINNNNNSQTFQISYLLSIGEGVYQLKNSLGIGVGVPIEEVPSYIEKMINQLIGMPFKNDIINFLNYQYNHAKQYSYGDLFVSLVQKHSGEEGTIYQLHYELLKQCDTSSKQYKYLNDIIGKMNEIQAWSEFMITRLVKEHKKQKYFGWILNPLSKFRFSLS